MALYNAVPLLSKLCRLWEVSIIIDIIVSMLSQYLSPPPAGQNDCSASSIFDYFECDSGQCVFDSDRCDSFTDCLDGSDEENCCESLKLILITINNFCLRTYISLSCCFMDSPEHIVIGVTTLYMKNNVHEHLPKLV